MNAILKGSLLVMGGAVSYGMLATIVKLSYKAGYTTSEITISQFVIGLIALLIIKTFSKSNSKITVSAKDKKKLILYGTTMGITSVFYYLSVQFLNASIAVVLLMQSVSFGLIYEAISHKKFPDFTKIMALILIAIGTCLATQILTTPIASEYTVLGYLFGLLSGLSFTITLISTNKIATHLPPATRGYFMILGGGIIVLAFALIAQFIPFYTNFSVLPPSIETPQLFNLKIFYLFGIPLALFGTVLPPILLNKGFPHIGIGLGSILSALELPVAVFVAYTFIDEKVKLLQWLGILLILSAIVLINKKEIKKTKKIKKT